MERGKSCQSACVSEKVRSLMWIFSPREFRFLLLLESNLSWILFSPNLGLLLNGKLVPLGWLPSVLMLSKDRRVPVARWWWWGKERQKSSWWFLLVCRGGLGIGELNCRRLFQHDSPGHLVSKWINIIGLLGSGCPTLTCPPALELAVAAGGSSQLAGGGDFLQKPHCPHHIKGICHAALRCLDSLQ